METTIPGEETRAIDLTATFYTI